MDLGAVLECAMDAARAAAAVHRQHAGRVTVSQWTEKGAADFVTHVDHEAEAAVIARIRLSFPDHHILAEEAASADGRPTALAEDPGWTWIVDPLDGTTNFLHGYPAYCVSVAASMAGVLQAGVVLNPVSGDMWHAVAGRGAYRNEESIRVSALGDLSQCLIGTGFPFKALHLLPVYLQQFDTVLRRTSGIRRAGSAALDLCHVATGWFDGFWELSLEPWDVAAGTLIVREAGGRVSRLDGSPDILGTGSILAGNPIIYQALAALVGTAHGVKADIHG